MESPAFELGREVIGDLAEEATTLESKVKDLQADADARSLRIEALIRLEGELRVRTRDMQRWLTTARAGDVAVFIRERDRVARTKLDAEAGTDAA